jgi:predicted metalloprotease with PDZ domain
MSSGSSTKLKEDAMMVVRRIARILFALAALGFTGAAPLAKPLDYTVAPEFKDGVLVALDVTLKMDADASGTTKLDLPDSSAGVTELWRYIGNVEIDGADSVSESGPAVRLVHARAGQPLTIRYRVTSAFPQPPDANNMDTYKPTVLPHWFWIYGESLFIVPDGGKPEVVFNWAGPKDFPFASDLERADGQSISSDDLIESVLVGGPDLKIHQRDAEGALRVAVVGTYPFSADTFADTATRIIRAERQFWHAREKPFLVVLAPITSTPGHSSTRGEGRRNAFAIMTTPEVPPNTLKAILAHEYFHTWNPERLGGMHDGDQERADYWFSEGFTDYYARKLLLESGEFSPKDFADDWNDALLAYANSPVRTAPNTKIVEGFWKDGSVEKLPYQRGAILAATWNRQLLEKSKGRAGLDDVMRTMQRDATRTDTKAPQLFEKVARRYGLDVSAQIKSVVEDGAPALLPANAFAPCFEVHTLTVPAFELGFDYEATRASSDQVVTGVKPESNAYRAGLRNGMTYLRREAGKYGESRQDYTIRVRDDGAERTITFRPEGHAMIALQEITPSPGCRAAQ